MAFNQEYLERCKAIGFYRHVEWKRDRGVLVKLYDENEDGVNVVSFEVGSFDVEHDQQMKDHRQFFLTRQKALKFMLNSGFNLMKIAKIFKQIDGCQVVQENI